jgi:hypothetical protein
MVEVFVIYIESVKYGTKGFLSKQTCKSTDGIHVEFLSEIQEGNPKADITNAVAYFTRGSAEKTKDLIRSEIVNKAEEGVVNIEVQSKQISLAESRAMNMNPWTYK